MTYLDTYLLREGNGHHHLGCRADPGDVTVPVLTDLPLQEVQVVLPPLPPGVLLQVDETAQPPQPWTASQQSSE